jgi:hypothetical protein
MHARRIEKDIIEGVRHQIKKWTGGRHRNGPLDERPVQTYSPHERGDTDMSLHCQRGDGAKIGVRM